MGRVGVGFGADGSLDGCDDVGSQTAGQYYKIKRVKPMMTA
jgi:hypothetical protein